MSQEQVVTQSEIQEMSRLVLFSKRLSEWHIKNLNLWPQIALEGLTKAEMDYSIGERPEECYVNYLVRFKRGTDLSDLELRCTHLEKWVKSILWTDIGFEVKSFNGKKLFPRKR